MTDDTANIHLEVLGEERTFCIPLPLGQRTPLELLPAARELTSQAAAVAIAQAAAQGREVQCRVGCSACCRHLVAVSPVEAVDLADHVAALPAAEQAQVRSRFAAALARLEATGLLDATKPPGHRHLIVRDQGSHRASVRELSRRYFQEQIPCPILEDERCSAYERRPMVCREHHVTSPPEHCARLDGRGVEQVAPPIDMAPTLARAAAGVANVPAQTLPLVLALEWAEAYGDALRQTCEGMKLMQTLVGELDPGYRSE